MLGALALVGTGLVGVQRSLDARYRDVVATRAALVGAVDPVATSPQVRWAVDTAVLDGLLLDQPVDGLVVGARSQRDGTVEATALDAATGATAWSTVLAGRPGERADVSGSGRGCTTTRLDGRAVLVCMIGYRLADQDGTAPAARGEVVVLDAATGTLVARRAAPRQAGAVVVEEGAAVLAWRVLGDVRVHAQDLVTGATVWQQRFSVPRTGTPTRVELTTPPRVARVQLAVGAGLVVVAAAQRVYLLGPDGTVRAEHGRLQGYLRDVRPDRVVVLTTNGPTGTLVVRPGQPDVLTADVALVASLDDDSLADVRLVTGDTLRADDARTGAQRWALDDGGTDAVVLDGTVYVAGSRTLVRAVDGRTGAVRWAVPLPDGASAGRLVTDGERLYAQVLGPDDAARWQVLGLDGLGAGTVRPPVGWDEPELRGRTLVVTSADGTRAGVLG